MPNIAHATYSRCEDACGVSRRGLLRGVAAMIGGAAALLAAGGTAIAKMAQKAAGYQDKPKGDQSCANCTLFKAPDSCTLVDGTITPGGWCRFYAKKS
jgi:hypothetical protein